ncbi:UBN2_3 domain-containing protein [Senna tora]|uniref:UBN2_3 domain-containing protein n=1 Tax=Senna tora TaxID=362788 RepID=A0A834X8C0_9FABA|nr:UBN2_3 domain-containing protein [Senna tora]
MAEQTPASVTSPKADEGPYLLHNSDHLGMALVTTMFNGSNYLAWSTAIKTSLQAKDKMGFIDGSILSPEDPIQYKRRYGMFLKKDLASQTDLNSIRCWDEIGRLMPLPTCTCAKCTRELSKKITDMDVSIKLLQFLMGLNSTYDNIQRQILNLDPLPTVTRPFLWWLELKNIDRSI